MDGTALDASLMGKVNLLMEWAIANDMITKDIEIRSGMRGPVAAHKMCVRFQLVHDKGRFVDFDALRALPGGIFHGWKFVPKPNATNDEIMEHAKTLYDAGSTGKVAAAGYAANHELRSPLTKDPAGRASRCTAPATRSTSTFRGAARRILKTPICGAGRRSITSSV